MIKYLIIVLMIFFSGCDDVNFSQDNLDLSLNNQSSELFAPGETVDVKVELRHEGILAAGDIVVNLACDNVYGTAIGDWTMNNVSTTSGGTVSVISGKACRITLLTYNDGSRVYQAVSSSLNVNISNTGSVTTASALQYTSGGGSPVLQWFGAVQGGAPYTVIFNYAADAISATTTPTIINLTGQAVTLTVAQITAPTVTSLNLYLTPALNGSSATSTLTAAVTNATSCRYIDNSAGTYTPTSWNSVNTAFTNVSSVTCPTLVDGAVGFSPGNWTSFWVSGTKILIMWANTVNGLSSYATANIGP